MTVPSLHLWVSGLAWKYDAFCGDSVAQSLSLAIFMAPICRLDGRCARPSRSIWSIPWVKLHGRSLRAICHLALSACRAQSLRISQEWWPRGLRCQRHPKPCHCSVSRVEESSLPSSPDIIKVRPCARLQLLPMTFTMCCLALLISAHWNPSLLTHMCLPANSMHFLLAPKSNNPKTLPSKGPQWPMDKLKSAWPRRWIGLILLLPRNSPNCMEPCDFVQSFMLMGCLSCKKAWTLLIPFSTIETVFFLTDKRCSTYLFHVFFSSWLFFYSGWANHGKKGHHDRSPFGENFWVTFNFSNRVDVATFSANWRFGSLWLGNRRGQWWLFWTVALRFSEEGGFTPWVHSRSQHGSGIYIYIYI